MCYCIDVSDPCTTNQCLNIFKIYSFNILTMEKYSELYVVSIFTLCTYFKFIYNTELHVVIIFRDYLNFI